MPKTLLRPLVLALMCVGLGCAGTAKLPEQPGQHTALFTQTVTYETQYLVHLPAGYTPDGPAWPLMIFLHGAGERGSDINLVKVHGPPKLADADPAFPFVVVSPQAATGTRWDAPALNALLDDVVANYAVDRDRIYVTGLSMGGFGTWDFATRYPNRVAAVAPICGGGAAWLACAMKEVPTWVFHGAKDQVVPLARSQEMVDALKACGANPKFTVYPEANHDSWTETYNNPALYEWLLSHRLSDR